MNLVSKIVLLLFAFYFCLFYLFITLKKTPNKISLNKKSFNVKQDLNDFSISSLSPSRFLDLQIPPDYKVSPDFCTIYFPTLSKDQINNFYNYKSYNQCKVPTNDTITFINTEVDVKCENGSKPYYYFKDSQEVLSGGRTHIYWLYETEGYTSSQFLLVKCSEKSIYTFVFNRYKESVSTKANSIKAKLGGEEKPFNVLLLVLDVVSRHSAYQNLPEVIEIVNGSVEEYGASVYEFQKASVVDIHTVNNMAQIIYGVTYEKIIQKFGGAGLLFFDKSHNEFIDTAIWNYYSRLGYTTMFLHDSVWEYLSTVTGKFINTDHVFVNFWRVALSVYGWHDFEESQRCAGPENSHNLSLTYTYQYFDNYPKNNKFAYVHLNAGHEVTGNIKTVDSDLAVFIKSFLRMMEQKDENFVFFLIGDHGRTFQHLKFNILNYFDSRSAFTSVFISKEVESRWNLNEILRNNTDKLLGRFDINLSLKHIAAFPFSDLNSFNYEKLKNSYPVKSVSSLFKEYIEGNRKCIDIGVKNEFCPCRWFESKPHLQKDDPELFNSLIQLITKFFAGSQSKYYNCEKLKVYDNVKIEEFVMDPFEEGLSTIYLVRLRANQKIFIEAKLNYFMYANNQYYILKSKESKSLSKIFKHKSNRIYLELEYAMSFGDCSYDCLC